MGMQLGYTMMTEQAGPKDLVAHVVGAEEAGFDFAVCSDHYFPWLAEMGHSPHAWTVLGAAAQATSRIPLTTFVTCPSFRYHPAVVAQKAATLQLLSEGRFRLGLGTGEKLNEHVVGGDWPTSALRVDMLAEAVDIIRALWAGGYVTHHGTHYEVEAARLWDLPETAPPIGIAVSGGESCELAAEKGDMLIATEPKEELVQAYGKAGGDGARIGQIPVCYDPDRAAAVSRAHDQFRWFGLGWKVNSELPKPSSFAGATSFVREDDISESLACGDDVGEFVDKIKPFVDAGFTDVALVQIGGTHQEPFFDWAESTLLPALRKL